MVAVGTGVSGYRNRVYWLAISRDFIWTIGKWFSRYFRSFWITPSFLCYHWLINAEGGWDIVLWHVTYYCRTASSRWWRRLEAFITVSVRRSSQKWCGTVNDPLTYHRYAFSGEAYGWRSPLGKPILRAEQYICLGGPNKGNLLVVQLQISQVIN